MKNFLFSILIFAVILPGCGYTTKSLLSDEYKTIYVDNFKNMIKITAEQTNNRMYRGYKPGMEINMRNAVIDKFLRDGNLKIAAEGKGDLILKTDFIDYKREPLSWDANDNVEEYRVKLVVNMEMIDAKNAKTLWTERGFTGECDYRTTGALAISEDSAILEAQTDLARRIVERTVEAW